MVPELTPEMRREIDAHLKNLRSHREITCARIDVWLAAQRAEIAALRQDRDTWRTAADANYAQWQTVDALKDTWGERLIAAEAQRDALLRVARIAHAGLHRESPFREALAAPEVQALLR